MGTAAEGREKQLNLIFMTCNCVCVIGIVILNKMIYSPPYNFAYGNTLMSVHFAFTAVLSWISSWCGLYQPRRPPIGDLLKISCAQVSSVALVNFSLIYNSVGMYQMLKLMTTPVVCVIDYYWKGVTQSTDTKTSLFVLLLGIALATVTEVGGVSYLGLFHGTLGTVTTAIYQILAGQVQKANNLTPQQVLHYMAPVTSVLFAVLALLFDDVKGMLTMEYSNRLVGLIILSGFLAYGINLTVFLIVARTSPLTYNVVGHLKTCCVFIFGFVVFHTPVEPKNLAGIFLALIGVFWYTYIKNRSAPVPAPRPVSPEPEDDEENQGSK